MTIDEAKKLAANEFGYSYMCDVVREGGDLDEVYERAMTIYAQAKAKEFAEWYSKLTPTKKITVHPPAGSGGSTGIYEMTIEQLYEAYLNKKTGI